MFISIWCETQTSLNLCDSLGNLYVLSGSRLSSPLSLSIFLFQEISFSQNAIIHSLSFDFVS